jgi:hypothetical protein
MEKPQADALAAPARTLAFLKKVAFDGSMMAALPRSVGGFRLENADLPTDSTAFDAIRDSVAGVAPKAAQAPPGPGGRGREGEEVVPAGGFGGPNGCLKPCKQFMRTGYIISTLEHSFSGYVFLERTMSRRPPMILASARCCPGYSCTRSVGREHNDVSRRVNDSVRVLKLGTIGSLFVLPPAIMARPFCGWPHVVESVVITSMLAGFYVQMKDTSRDLRHQ